MQVRRLVPSDAPAFRATRLRAFREHPEAFTTDHDEFAAEPPSATEDRLRRPGLKFWGGFEGESLCGHLGLEHEARAKVAHKAKVIGMYVAPEVRGRGLGRALVDALVREARADGLELLTLTVTEGNAAATDLYERCGFRSFGIEPRAIKAGGRAWGKNHMYLDLLQTNPTP